MDRKRVTTIAWANFALVLLGSAGPIQAQSARVQDAKATYPSMAPLERSTAGPTRENALAAEQAIGQALLANDADAVSQLLDPDWAVISTDGGIGDGVRDGFCAAIKSGQFTRKTFVLDLLHARVRLYGNLALITVNLATSGMIGSRPFDVKEVQTDVLKWQDGDWKSVLTHETKVKEK